MSKINRIKEESNKKYSLLFNLTYPYHPKNTNSDFIYLITATFFVSTLFPALIVRKYIPCGRPPVL